MYRLRQMCGIILCAFGFHDFTVRGIRGCLVKETCTREGCNFERYDVRDI
jgi:hypothetical protein